MPGSACPKTSSTSTDRTGDAHNGRIFAGDRRRSRDRRRRLEICRQDSATGLQPLGHKTLGARRLLSARARAGVAARRYFADRRSRGPTCSRRSRRPRRCTRVQGRMGFRVAGTSVRHCVGRPRLVVWREVDGRRGVSRLRRGAATAREQDRGPRRDPWRSGAFDGRRDSQRCVRRRRDLLSLASILSLTAMRTCKWDTSVAWALERIATSEGCTTVGGIAREIGWSRRHLHRRFVDQVGLGPKTCVQLTRFHAALGALENAREEPLGRDGSASWLFRSGPSCAGVPHDRRDDDHRVPARTRVCRRLRLRTSGCVTFLQDLSLSFGA